MVGWPSVEEWIGIQRMPTDRILSCHIQFYLICPDLLFFWPIGLDKSNVSVKVVLWYFVDSM